MKPAKVVLVGEPAVGTTCIVDQFCRGSIDPMASPTLGAAYSTGKIFCDGREVTLLIWDTAGQERFRVLTPMYYRGTNAVIIVYSIDAETSFREVDFWVQSVRDNVDEAVPIVIVGNKSDLVNQRQVDVALGQQKADEHGAMFFETSAVSGAYIHDLFLAVASAVFCEGGTVERREAPQPLVEIDPGTKKRCC
jgi:small GTP-binding protein